MVNKKDLSFLTSVRNDSVIDWVLH